MNVELSVTIKNIRFAGEFAGFILDVNKKAQKHTKIVLIIR